MQIVRTRIATCLVTAVFFFVSSQQSLAASDKVTTPPTEPGLMTADIALARPAGVLATVAGFAIFVVSSPFSAMGGNTKEAWQSLVAEPANYTFKRPLGHFDEQSIPPPER